MPPMLEAAFTMILATVTIINSTVDGNSAAYDSLPFRGGQGGGIYNDEGTVMIISSIVSNNHAGLPRSQLPDRYRRRHN